jgi:intracellular multiplication protein IcmB
LRNYLYDNLGASNGREILAKFFPGGTARHEIRRRIVIRAERGELETGSSSYVIQELANELIAHARQDTTKLLVKG